MDVAADHGVGGIQSEGGDVGRWSIDPSGHGGNKETLGKARHGSRNDGPI